MLACEFNALELGFNRVKLTAHHVTGTGIDCLKTIRMDKDFGSAITIGSQGVNKFLHRGHIKFTDQS
jgi:hypothetical protein